MLFAEGRAGSKVYREVGGSVSLLCQEGTQTSLSTLGTIISANMSRVFAMSALKLRSVYVGWKVVDQTHTYHHKRLSIISKGCFYGLLIKLPHWIVSLLTVIIISLLCYR